MRALASLVCVLAVALVGCASPKPAATPITAASAGPPSPASEREWAQKLIDKSIETGEAIKTTEGTKLVCRKESITNTRLRSRKVCLTEEQWAQRTDTAQQAFEEADQPGLPPTEKTGLFGNK